jgi:hypothetical protein
MNHSSESRSDRIGLRSFLFAWSHFRTANRYPPSDQVRGHASPENALMLSTATIILAGIPAVIDEHGVGAKDNSTDVSNVDLACRCRITDAACRE